MQLFCPRVFKKNFVLIVQKIQYQSEQMIGELIASLQVYKNQNARKAENQNEKKNINEKNKTNTAKQNRLKQIIVTEKI